MVSRREPTAFTAFVKALGSGQLIAHRHDGSLDETIKGEKAVRYRLYRRPIAWTKPADAAAHAEMRRRETEAEAAEGRQRELRQQRSEALVERQRRLTPLVVTAAKRATAQAAWAGDPPVAADEVIPHRYYAGGAAVFVDHFKIQLWAVVYPVAGRIEDRHRFKWRGVRVYAETASERDRLRRARRGRDPAGSRTGR